MSRTRRTFSKEFKTKVVLEALREHTTIEVLAKKYELLPTQISIWKVEAVKNMYFIFCAINSGPLSTRIRSGLPLHCIKKSRTS